MRSQYPAVLIALTGLLLAGCGNSGSNEQSSSASSSSDSTSVLATAPAKPVKAPLSIPLPINFIEQKYGIKVNAVDIGRHIVDGVDHERTVFDAGNWRIVAQCDFMTGNTLNAGVIKSDEFEIISKAHQAASISENFFKSLLDCPADQTAAADNTTTAAPTTTETSAPSTRPAPTDAEVKQAFQAYITDRANSGVMLASSVTSVTVAGGVVTIIANPDPVLLESGSSNLAKLFGTPVEFNDDQGIWLRQTVQRVDVVDAAGNSLGSMTAAELNKMGVG